MMPQYSNAFKARVLQRLVGPRAISASRLAAEVGVPQLTFSRWLASARSVPTLRTPPQQWSGAQELRVVLARRMVHAHLDDCELLSNVHCLSPRHRRARSAWSR